MKKEIYKKILENRLDNIQKALENIYNRLKAEKISYPEFLYLENNIYSSMIETQHELYSLKYVNDFETEQGA